MPRLAFPTCTQGEMLVSIAATFLDSNQTVPTCQTKRRVSLTFNRTEVVEFRPLTVSCMLQAMYVQHEVQHGTVNWWGFANPKQACRRQCKSCAAKPLLTQSLPMLALSCSGCMLPLRPTALRSTIGLNSSQLGKVRVAELLHIASIHCVGMAASVSARVSTRTHAHLLAKSNTQSAACLHLLRSTTNGVPPWRPLPPTIPKWLAPPRPTARVRSSATTTRAGCTTHPAS